MDWTSVYLSMWASPLKTSNQQPKGRPWSFSGAHNLHLRQKPMGRITFHTHLHTSHHATNNPPPWKPTSIRASRKSNTVYFFPVMLLVLFGDSRIQEWFPFSFFFSLFIFKFLGFFWLYGFDIFFFGNRNSRTYFAFYKLSGLRFCSICCTVGGVWCIYITRLAISPSDKG